MRSFRVVVPIIVVFSWAGLLWGGEVRSESPNILLVVTDDQRHDAVGFRHPILETPQMDALAGSGVWFSNAFATTPICSASRATLLTGLHERTHGYGFGDPMSLSMLEMSYPRLLREAGFVTGFVGKNGTHLDEERRQFLFDHFVQVGLPYLAEREGEWIHASDYTANKAVEFIELQTAAQPFLLTVAFHAPHAEDQDPRQFIPPERFSDLYQGIDHPDPPLSDPAFFDAQPAFLRECLNRVRWFWRWTPELSDGMLSSYLAMIRGVDDAVGEILNALEVGGLLDNTVVILISDNGALVGERGFAGKWLAYEPSIRIPLIIRDFRGEGVRGGTVVDEIVLNLDVPETILDLAQVPVPEIMQGDSLAPFVIGQSPTWRDDTFLEHTWTPPTTNFIPRHESLRSVQMKYIHYIEHGWEELYDLGTDPDEAVNLAEDPIWHDELVAMRERTVELRNRYRGPVFFDGFESGDTTGWR